MNTIRFNITLEKELGLKLKKIKNKSKFIGQSIKQMLEKANAEKDAELLKSAYRASCEDDKNISSEWDHTIGDGI